LSPLPVKAGLTPLGSSSEPSVSTILSTIYTNGEVFTRVQDFEGSASTEGLPLELLHVPGFPGRTDQTWTDGIVRVDVHAKFAGYSQVFGWERSNTNHELFAVSGSGYEVTGGVTNLDLTGGTFHWTDKTNGTTLFSSDVSKNSDDKDHMITFLVTGPNISSTTWVVCFEDTEGGGDRDYNDLVVEIVVNDCPWDPNKTSPGVCGCGVPDTDTDGDGTPDCIDECPNDSNKTEPGQCGCGTPDTDSDGDGTANCVDGCPNDPDKTSPGVCGCGVPDFNGDGGEGCDPNGPSCGNGICEPFDGEDCVSCPADCRGKQDGPSYKKYCCGDGDGYKPVGCDDDRCNSYGYVCIGDCQPDCGDACPDDPNKTAPGQCGCGVPDTDTDGDGQADCVDGCPNDPNKTTPGACGCGVADTDSDGDGTENCHDGCPNDPSKTAPGQCGCGVPDTDWDSDGTANCNDGCPKDPDKVDPGQCGCGESDADTDGDGTADCNDGCPNDANKIAGGQCGCGVADTDSDGDGTANCNDACPNDPTKIAAGPCGCGVPDTDSDGDGTADCVDGCPGDPSKTAPGVCGCGVPDVDGDGDGVLNCLDDCPADPNKSAPGACGCGNPDTDTDGDGTADCNDDCPNDPNKTSAGACGCGVADTDSDGDGTPDCDDGCPGDPAKSQGGACGCGVADVDSDGDGTADCIDGCPNDANKTSAGVCGCGVPDVDSDGDGVMNCVDGCPGDPNKTNPGVCGCGVADTDSDLDGVPNCNDQCPDAPDVDTDGDGVLDCADGCPHDPNKLAPGICGCGVSDADSDGDGTANCNDACPNDPNKTTAGVCGCGVADTSILYARAGSRITVRSLSLDGNGMSNNADCIKFLSCAHVNLYDIEAIAARIGVQLLGCTDSSLAFVYAGNQVRDSGANDARGISIGDLAPYTGTARIQLANIRIYLSEDHGLVIFTDAADIELANIHLLSNAGSGLRASNSILQGANIWACANLTGLYLISCSEVSLLGFHAFSNAQHGLRLEAVVNSKFVGECRNNGTAAANNYDGVYVDDTGGVGSTGNTFDITSRNTGATGQRYGYNSAGASSGNNIINGNLQNNQTGPGVFAATDIKRNIYGRKTEANGAGAIASGATTAVITHGLDVTPSAKDITITPTVATSNPPGHIWVDTCTSTQFTVNCTADPGASTLAFAWHAAVL